MKKNRIKDQEKTLKPRRLSLNRETIRSLNEPTFLELARGAFTMSNLDPGCGPLTYHCG
ncbi:MAG TPA: hypothetical protein VKM72_32215 [Thermoanaerobaculia bacterium]|nr:hypothetical protein [Thermoanaerobaculia bacterium]